MRTLLRHMLRRVLDEPWPDTIIFVRHAQSEGNLLDPDQRAATPIGTNLYALTTLGEEQATITGAWLRHQFPNPDGFYTSYYTRTQATAARCYPDREPYVDERLAEAQRGIRHTMTSADIARQMPWENERRAREGLYHYRPPGGENCPDIELRIRSWNHTMHRRYAGRTIVVVTHGNWLLLWKKIIHHWTIDQYVAAYEHEDHPARAANASVTIYRGVRRKGQSIIIPDPNEPYIVPWEGKIDAGTTSMA